MSITPFTLFYAICGILMVGLLLRMAYKKRRDARRGTSLPTGARPARGREAAVPLATHVKPADAVDTAPQVLKTQPVDTVPGAEGILRQPQDAAAAGSADLRTKANGATNGHSMHEMPLEMTYHAQAQKNVSWENQSLLRNSRLSGPAPERTKVDVENLPTIDKSDYVFGSATPVFAQLLPESDQRRDELKRELVTAGYYQPHAWQNLAAIRYVAIMGSILFFGLLLLIAPPRFEIVVAGMLIVAALFGWALPRLYVKSKAADRKSEIDRGLPDMLDMLNMCVSQGLTVPDSLERVSRELQPVYPALAKELAIVSDQARIGTLEHALRNFADRLDIPEVHSFTSLLIQTERMGTSVSAALIDYSDNMRESLRQTADTKANQASFKLLFPTVLCLMPAVYLILLGPAIIEFANFFRPGGGRDMINNTQRTLQDGQ